ncbi:hypothetical protein ALC53_06995 [Atta colombica]|uniref:Uncharacterized protein n=2 Tax=Attini TaxID=143999 RepID=A0A195BEB3_9HYME|nr:hypothetical protein G5I_02998 [Acromyrmex echinatior]KYM82505.1 hypothetical protein ALC53_06995 [Atta colombica]
MGLSQCRQANITVILANEALNTMKVIFCTLGFLNSMGELPIWIANSRFRVMAFWGVEKPRVETILRAARVHAEIPNGNYSGL